MEVNFYPYYDDKLQPAKAQQNVYLVIFIAPTSTFHHKPESSWVLPTDSSIASFTWLVEMTEWQNESY